jgi:proline iminopeptidase
MINSFLRALIGTPGKSQTQRIASKSARCLSFASFEKKGQQGRSSSIGGFAFATAGTIATLSTATAEAEAAETGEDPFKHTALYPQPPCIQKGTIKTGIHTVAFSVYGNPNGKPVLFVHGGPGGGTQPGCARFFDPKAYKIVLVDQRGCGESTPFAELRENTTWDSVRDFEKIRQLLQIDKWQVFGGSWGSTLSLAYAQEHPDRVTELVLRGIFLLREKEINFFYQGPGSNFIFPEDWKLYEEAIPENERDDYIKAYGRRLRGELGEEEQLKAAKAWSIWEGRTSKLVQDPWDNVKDRFGDAKFALPFARIENHYFTNKGFFPRDGYLIEKKQIDKIRHIPTFVVQGRYDCVCPARSAYDLSIAFPEATVKYTLTGHSSYEHEIIAELVAATERFKHGK